MRCILTLTLALILSAAGASAQSQLTPPKSDPTNRTKIDLLITARYVVTMDATMRVIENGAVAIQGDLILAVGPRAAIEAKFVGKNSISAPDGLIMPGLINGHTHAAMTLLRGIKDDVTLHD
jgi:5-methylthioadenosine/S-adenosylhomocysteine deaminase